MQLPNNESINMKRGYTLVEILIIITIIAILVTFGLSAYGKAQERQVILQSKELILSVLQNAQKSAYVGDKDCDQALEGIEITFSSNNIVTKAKCAGGDGLAKSTSIPNITFTGTPTVTFRPLEQGVAFSSGSQANIVYRIGSKNYQITVSKPGTITYIGEI